MPSPEPPLNAEHLIRQSGLKCTRSRLQVLEMLLAQREVLTADEIYEKLLQTGARLNFSTVYRILENFTEKKLTEKVLLPQSRKYGFLLYTLSHTHHLICLGCHKVQVLQVFGGEGGDIQRGLGEVQAFLVLEFASSGTGVKDL